MQIVKDAGVPIFAKPGFEADDLIATMAKELCEQDYEIFLVSKDKDLRQLLTPCVHMYDVQGDEVIDEARLMEKVGYSPREAVEVQTLMGDAIDNVPGIPGVGEKTAAKLIKKYGHGRRDPEPSRRAHTPSFAKTSRSTHRTSRWRGGW